MAVLIKKFSEISLADVQEVGGKNASLGEMFTQLSSKGICVPNGFATTASAFQTFLEENNLKSKLSGLLKSLDRKDFSNLKEIGSKARNLIMHADISNDLARQIILAYQELTKEGDKAVAVRSSATAEDLPEASFAGQHESFLNVRGEVEILVAVQKCFASLYTDRAIKYREDNGFDHDKVSLSAGVQYMVRSDKGCSGVAFTLEPESAFVMLFTSVLFGVWGKTLCRGQLRLMNFLFLSPH